MYDRKKNIHEHLNNIHRETTTVMKLNQRLSYINSIYTWVFSISSLLALLFFLLFFIMNTMIPRRVSISVFPLETENYQIYN